MNHNNNNNNNYNNNNNTNHKSIKRNGIKLVLDDTKDNIKSDKIRSISDSIHKKNIPKKLPKKIPNISPKKSPKKNKPLPRAKKKYKNNNNNVISPTIIEGPRKASDLIAEWNKKIPKTRITNNELYKASF